jgi:hypothetical protein
MEDPVNVRGPTRGSHEKDDDERSVTSMLGPPAAKVTQFLSKKLSTLGVEARGAYHNSNSALDR